MQLVADDPINRSIWAESVALQRKIAERETQPLRVGAQQAMSKPCDQALFSPKRPLPWVPDLVGSRFGSDRRSVLVVASSYNGFIEGYSRRAAVLPLTDYADAKKAGVAGLVGFIARFKECVVDRDEDYYQPILRDLLAASGCSLEDCCVTDLCKASFVQRGSGPDSGSRGDKGDDYVVRNYWQQWIPYVAGLADGGREAPLPYRWLWQRMQNCRVVVTLGTIAEYGVLKIFQSMVTAPKAWSWKDSSVVPDHPTMTAEVSDWECTYASSRRKLRDWLADEDWWVLGDSSSKPHWFMLPVHHPSSAIGRGNDTKYQNTVPRVRRMMEEATSKL
ncbi:MAG: hypothetical protein ACLQVW_18000 [Limisphaerales bacterium]